jgi:hypothetical protein
VITRITVMFDNPVDPVAVEARYRDRLAPAREVPGVQQVRSAEAWPKEDGSPTPAYRLLDLDFVDYAAASAAVTTEAAAAFLPSVLEPPMGGVRIVFTAVEAV